MPRSFPTAGMYGCRSGLRFVINHAPRTFARSSAKLEPRAPAKLTANSRKSGHLTGCEPAAYTSTLHRNVSFGSLPAESVKVRSPIEYRRQGRFQRPVAVTRRLQFQFHGEGPVLIDGTRSFSFSSLPNLMPVAHCHTKVISLGAAIPLPGENGTLLELPDATPGVTGQREPNHAVIGWAWRVGDIVMPIM